MPSQKANLKPYYTVRRSVTLLENQMIGNGSKR